MSVSHAQLKAFHAVAVHGSFTKAAERLFLTQPAISDQVRNWKSASVCCCFIATSVRCA